MTTIEVKDLYQLESLCETLLRILDETQSGLLPRESLEEVRQTARALHHYDFPLPDFVTEAK